MNPVPDRLSVDDYRISVVMPVFSETGTVCTIVEWLRANLGARLLEIIIVISPDLPGRQKTFAAGLHSPIRQSASSSNRKTPASAARSGKGYARTRGNVVLSIDSDGEMELATIPRMIAEMARSNFGLVVGSRWLPGGGFVGYSPEPSDGSTGASSSFSASSSGPVSTI